jgi:hypothetical protein
MYSLRSLWDIFELEFFLFGGVPETAVQMYERESHGHAEVRHTRETLGSNGKVLALKDEDFYCELEFDKETGYVVEVEVSGS